MTSYQLDPQRCGLRARARSNLHSFQAEARTLTGEIEAVIVDGDLDLDQPATAHIVLPVAHLRADNALVTQEIQNRLDSRRFPTVTATVNKVNSARNGGYQLYGELTLRHVTRPVTAGAVLIPSDPETLYATAELGFDIRDFQLDPPKLLGLRVHPGVIVTVRIVAITSHHH